MIINMYAHKNETLQRYTAPFLCINNYTAMNNFREMRAMLRDIAKDETDADLKEMNKQEFSLYYLGIYNTETAEVTTVIPEKICDEESVDKTMKEWEEKNGK